MQANATLKSFLANMDPSRKSGWPDLCLVLHLWYIDTARMQKKVKEKLMVLKFVDVVSE